MPENEELKNRKLQQFTCQLSTETLEMMRRIKEEGEFATWPQLLDTLVDNFYRPIEANKATAGKVEVLEAKNAELNAVIIELKSKNEKLAADTSDTNRENEEYIKMLESQVKQLSDDIDTLRSKGNGKTLICFIPPFNFSTLILNNVKDITMDERYETICGITEKELLENFDEGICELAKRESLTYYEVCQKLKKWYDGYSFCENGTGLYNPFSILNTFDSLKFQDYWFATGTPTFLVNMLKNGNYNMIDVEKSKMRDIDMSKITVDSGDPVQILYQSGYLTIKDYNKRSRVYTLGFPNQEVKEGFYACLAPVFLEVKSEKVIAVSIDIKDCLLDDDIDGFMDIMKEFLPKIPYFFHTNQKTDERHFQEIFYILLLSAGLNSRVEEYSVRGRSDIIAESSTSVFVFELKIDKSVEDALQQIEDKAYIEQYRATKKNIYAIGVYFNSEKRCIDDYRVCNVYLSR